MFVKFVVVLFTLTCFAQDTTYYVDLSGTDDASCGAITSPCASINQVITNNPGASFTASISEGIFETGQIELQKSAFVIFKGSENTSIEAKWESYTFISNTDTSGFEFRDLLLYLFSDRGTDFSTLSGAGNTFGFYNVKIFFVGFTEARLFDFIVSYGGSLILSNVSCNVALLDSFFIVDRSSGNASNITIIKSNFTNLNIMSDGGFLEYIGLGAANILIDSTNFNRIGADELFIGIWIRDENQAVTITNNIFTNSLSYLPCVYIEYQYQCVINIQNTSWENISADFVSAAIETLGPGDGLDPNMTLNNLTFINCNSNYAGAILVGFSTLTLSNSAFSNNTGSAGYGNDVVQALDSGIAMYKYVISNCSSSSPLPKAGVWDIPTDKVTDISNELPGPSRIFLTDVVVRHPTRKEISAQPKSARKVRKNKY